MRSSLVLACLAVLAACLAGAVSGQSICDRYTTALGFSATTAEHEYALVDAIVKRAVFGVINYSATLGVTTGTVALLDSTTVTSAPKVTLRSTSNFGTVNLATSERSVILTGLTTATTLKKITRRPSNGLLYALGSDGQLYSADLDGAITGGNATITMTPLGAPVAARVAGPNVGMDVNPQGDALRIVTGAKNFRVNLNTGEAAGGDTPDGTDAGGSLTIDQTLSPADPNAAATINAAATCYTNQVSVATSQTQYLLDTTLGLLQTTGSNAGTFKTLGALSGITGTIDYSSVAMRVVTSTDGATNTILLLAKVTNNDVASVGLYSLSLTGVATKVFDASSSAFTGFTFTTTSLGSNGIHNPLNAVPGILAPSANNLPFFNGAVKFRGDATPVFTNGGSPLATLLDHLAKFFGRANALGCTASGFPAYDGVESMLAVHGNMNITKPVFTYFNGQVAASATSFGVSTTDTAAVGSLLNSFSRGAGAQTICTQPDCDCVAGTTAPDCVPIVSSSTAAAPAAGGASSSTAAASAAGGASSSTAAASAAGGASSSTAVAPAAGGASSSTAVAPAAGGASSSTAVAPAAGGAASSTASAPASQATSSTGANAGGGGGGVVGSTSSTGASTPAATGSICDRYTTTLGFNAATAAHEVALVDSIVKRAVFGVVNYSATLGVAAGSILLLDNSTPASPKLIARSTGNLGVVNPAVSERTYTLSGLTASTTLKKITRRPSNGLFYALGSDGQLYSLSLAINDASVSTGTLTPLGTPVAARAAGTHVAMDVNPQGDALRIVTGAKNFRVALDTGLAAGGATADGTDAGGPLTIDQTLSPADPNAAATLNVAATAYTQQRTGATGTTQYLIDATLGLLQSTAPNAGTCKTLGALTGITGNVDYSTATLRAITSDDGSKDTLLFGAKVTPTSGTATYSIYSLSLTGVATKVSDASNNIFQAWTFAPTALANNGIHNPANAVPGILAAGSNNLPYFNGAVQYKGASTPVYTNGGAPLATLLERLYQFFGSSSALNCTATGFPAYAGVANMNTVHANMNISKAVFTYFNGQVAASARSFGVAQTDIDSVGGVLASFGRGSTQAICTQPDCDCVANPATPCTAPAGGSMTSTAAGTGAAGTTTAANTALPAGSTTASPTGTAGTTAGTGTGGSGAPDLTAVNFQINFDKPNSFWTNTTTAALRQEIAAALGVDVSRIFIGQSAPVTETKSFVLGSITGGTPSAASLLTALSNQANTSGSALRLGPIGQSATSASATGTNNIGAASSAQVTWAVAIAALLAAMFAKQL